MRVIADINVALFVLLLSAAVFAQQQAPGTPPARPPGPTTQTPPPPAPTTATPGAPPTVATAAREFTAPVGLIFNTVRPERVADFEKVLAYLYAAFDKVTDPTVRAQVKGWRILKSVEPGPNGSVLYVFLLDPTVMGADYGLSRILAEAYPDTAELSAIWNLYTGSVTSGGNLLNLMPVAQKPPPLLSAPTTPADTTPTPRTSPPDADPNRKE